MHQGVMQSEYNLHEHYPVPKIPAILLLPLCKPLIEWQLFEPWLCILASMSRMDILDHRSLAPVYEKDTSRSSMAVSTWNRVEPLFAATNKAGQRLVSARTGGLGRQVSRMF